MDQPAPLTDNEARAYLAAMIDGEGWVSEYKGSNNRGIRIANTEEDIIAAIQSCLDQLGITYRVVRDTKPARPHWAKRITIDIYGLDNLGYILDHVPFRSTRKRERLARTVASYRKPLDEATLRRLYLDEGLTEIETAARLGVSLKRVKYARKLYGIPARQGADRAESIWRIRRAKYGVTGRREASGA